MNVDVEEVGNCLPPLLVAALGQVDNLDVGMILFVCELLCGFLIASRNTVGQMDGLSKYRSYQRIEQDLRRRIVRGEWSPGMMMPGRRELARQYGVDVNTLQRAIGPLLDSGILVADGKRGTFIGSNDGNGQAVGSRRVTPASSPQARSDELKIAGKVIGVLVPVDPAMNWPANLHSAKTWEAVRSIERAVAVRGGATRLINMGDPADGDPSVSAGIKIVRNAGAEAVILIDPFDNPRVLDELRLIGYNGDMFVVLVSGVGNYVPSPHVYYDQHHAGFISAKELIQCGWDPITFITPYAANWLSQRVEGARMATRQFGSADGFFTFPPHVEIEQFDPHTDEVARVIIRQAFESGKITGGIIAPNDSVANIVLDEAKNYGALVGKDFAVSGFDDDPESGFRGLSSVRPPFDDMGEMAVDLVVKYLNGKPANLQISLEAHFIPRASTTRRHGIAEKAA